MNTTQAVNDTLRRSRTVEQVVTGQAVSDGAGVRLLRVLTGELQRRLDPFLMLDEFGSDNPDDYIAGFPDHPHRGFETVTYMLTGRMRHRDNAGHEGLLTAGAVQWMTAGRGIVHSEIPEQSEGRMHGFQLWINLPAERKMIAPHYEDLGPETIPEATPAEGVRVKVIAGHAAGIDGPIQRPDTEPLYLDLILSAGTTHHVAVPTQHNAFLYVYEGTVTIGDTRVGPRAMAVLSSDGQADGVSVAADGDARALLIAGRPLGEPIAQWGPFVMNTREEIEQALEEYRAGHFGERAF